MLAGVMAKLGTYGIIRFDLDLFPQAVVDLAPLLLTLGGRSGSSTGRSWPAPQRDLKRLVAYSSLAHLGFIVLGIFALTTQGLTGARACRWSTTASSIGRAVHPRSAASTSGAGTCRRASSRGLQQAGARCWPAVFTVVMLASIGLPGLNGFVGEFLILVGHLPHPPLVGRGRHRWA